MPAKVFISYSTHDLAVAEKAKAVLSAAGHFAYVADFDAPGGSRLSEELKLKIEESDILVVLWSQHAKGSDWVSQEIGIAEGKNKIVIPVLLQPELKAPGFISDRKYVSAHEDIEDAIRRVREAVDIEGVKKEKAQGWLILGAAALLIALFASE